MLSLFDRLKLFFFVGWIMVGCLLVMHKLPTPFQQSFLLCFLGAVLVTVVCELLVVLLRLLFFVLVMIFGWSKIYSHIRTSPLLQSILLLLIPELYGQL